MAIRWRPQDIKTLQTRVRVFNTTLTKLGKDEILKPYLPARISVQELRDRITTRAEFNREINALKRFNKSTAIPVRTEGGVQTTKWELADISRRIRLINRQRAKERALLPVNPATQGLLISDIEASLSPRKQSARKVPYDAWENYRQKIIQQSRADYAQLRRDIYRENYFSAIYNEFGEKADVIYDIIKDLDGDQIYFAYRENPLLTIRFVYTEEEMDFLIERLVVEWQDYVDSLEL